VHIYVVRGLPDAEAATAALGSLQRLGFDFFKVGAEF
jgi:hypothetical protein